MKLAFLILSLIFMCLQKNATSSLPKPCRAWLDFCGDGLYVCTTEEQFMIESARCQNDSTNPGPSPPEGCMLVNGSCQFTSSVPTCAAWQVDCTTEYACGTLQQYESTISCPYLLGTPPPPEEMCTPLEERCGWFQPCRSWQNYCNGEYLCGTLSEYWTFMNSPHPACTAATSADIIRIPPGRCIVQDGHCAWSNCMAWMNICRTSWLCGTEHDSDLYQVLPPPPCPPIDAAHLLSEQPGICSYNSTLRQCQFTQAKSQCLNGKVYTECGSACPATCENRENTIVCPQICVPGCFCPDGTVDNNGTCIDPIQCSDIQDPPPECTNGKEFSSCGSACPPTCDSSDIICTLGCISGCFCPAGMVEYNGTCIDPLLCPTTQDLQCSGGRVYTNCGSACSMTCENIGRESACPLICVSGCSCPAGTVDYNGTCIDPLHCPNAQTVDVVSSSRQEKLIITIVVVTLLTTLLSVVGVVFFLRRKLAQREQYTAVLLINEESTKESIKVKDIKPFKHISVSQIASSGILNAGLGTKAERMVTV